MALVTIREYADIAQTSNKVVQAPAEPGTDQSVTTSGTSAQSTAFGTDTTLVMVSTPPSQAVACVFGLNPTALVTSPRLPAGQVFFFGVRKGYKVAFIDVA